MRSVSRGDTKNVCLLFNSLLPPGKSRERRERKEEKCLSFLLKKHSLSLSLFSSALSLSSDMLCFGCRFVFFFLSFRALLFVLGENQALVFSLSFFPSRGDRKPHHPFVSLSLSYEERAFWKTRSPSRMLRRTQKERGMIISEKEEIDSSDNSRAKAGKKKMDWISRLIAAREPQPQRESSRQRRKRMTNKSACCVLPSVRPRGACLQNSFSSVALIYIYVCVYILYQISLTNAFVISARCCVRRRTKTKL